MDIQNHIKFLNLQENEKFWKTYTCMNWTPSAILFFKECKNMKKKNFSCKHENLIWFCIIIVNYENRLTGDYTVQKCLPGESNLSLRLSKSYAVQNVHLSFDMAGTFAQ